MWFVTTRVTEGRFWLHPLLSSGLEPRNRADRRLRERYERHFDKRLGACVKAANEHRGPYQPELSLQDVKRIAQGNVGSAFGRAQQRHGTQVFGLVVMSNHIHALVRTRGKNLAAFMRDVKSAITSAINLITGKRGSLWEDRYHAEPVVDEEGCADRQGYLLDNPSKAKLVEAPDDWPGLNLAFGFGGEDCVEFEYLDRTAWHKAGRPKNLKPFFKKVTLELSPLPSCEGLSREECRKSLQSWIAHSHAKHEAKQDPERRGRPKRVLGVDKIIFTAFDTRPKAPRHGRRPYVFGAPAACRQYTRANVARTQTYGELSTRYRDGDRTVQFPEGMYPPPITHAA